MNIVRVPELADVRNELDATRAALEYANRRWKDLEGLPEFRGTKRPEVRQALEHLEDTYIVRLSIEFEEILRDYWRNHRAGTRMPQGVERLINRIATLESIPSEQRDHVHAVRNHRNYFVHRTGNAPPPITFRVAMSYLTVFLNGLPN
jgi:hypothetical protein